MEGKEQLLSSVWIQWLPVKGKLKVISFGAAVTSTDHSRWRRDSRRLLDEVGEPAAKSGTRLKPTCADQNRGCPSPQNGALLGLGADRFTVQSAKSQQGLLQVLPALFEAIGRQ